MVDRTQRRLGSSPTRSPLWEPCFEPARKPTSSLCSHTCCLCHPAYHPFPLFTNLAPSDLGPLSEIEFTLKDMLFIQGGYVVGMLTL